MKFDNIIIGGGLAGLTAAIRLAERGTKVALVSAGRSALMFNTGSLGLLGFDDSHERVSDWSQSVLGLPASHPYSKIGADRIKKLADDSRSLLSDCGLAFHGAEHTLNHSRISPVGITRPAWLTLGGLLTDDSLRQLQSSRVALIGIAGFLDFYPRFIASALQKSGYECEVHTIDTSDLRVLRSSESEMRSVNIARILHGYALINLAEAIKKLDIPFDTVLVLPAVIEPSEYEIFSELIRRPFLFAPTLGASVPGLTIHNSMVRRLQSLGGRVFNGHRVNGAHFDGDRLVAVTTDKLDEDRLIADNFIFAGGSFFSHGVLARPDSIIEPVFGLDTVAPPDRSKWFAPDLFDSQPVMKAGVATDTEFHAVKNSTPVSNLYVIGSALSGTDSVREESGAGVAMLTALAVADTILKQN